MDHSKLSAMIPSFSKLNNAYLCLWAIFDEYILHVIVTKTIYFVRYYKKSTETWLEAKHIGKRCPNSKNWFPLLSSPRSTSTGLSLKNPVPRTLDCWEGRYAAAVTQIYVGLGTYKSNRTRRPKATAHGGCSNRGRTQRPKQPHPASWHFQFIA